MTNFTQINDINSSKKMIDMHHIYHGYKDNLKLQTISGEITWSMNDD